jgi:hypothetical protein
MAVHAELSLTDRTLLLGSICVLLFLGAPIRMAAEVPAADRDARAKQKREFATYLVSMAPDVRERYFRQRARIPVLRAQIATREAAGQNTTCSHQILTEVSWLAGSVMDPARIEKRLDDLASVLARPEEEAKAEQQDPFDGSWGSCHDEWFFKVNATFDHLTKPSHAAEAPRYRLQLFDRVNSPEKLREYFEGLAVSDLPRTGMDHRKELNESLSNLIRLILRSQPASYGWHPKLKDALKEVVLQRLRNPQTGWWGESYVRNGRVEFVDDLSMTFHVISYLRGDVPNLAGVADHLLAVKDVDYPIGWLEGGRNSNHNNMDVVTLFRIAWPSMNGTQKQAAAAEIHRMLGWCLRESLQSDGAFTADIGSSDSTEESNSWGVSFLARMGFFDPTKRFWTDETFPQAEQILQKLISFIEKHKGAGGAGGTYYENALGELKIAKSDK